MKTKNDFSEWYVIPKFQIWGVMFLVVPPKEGFAQMPLYNEFVKKTPKMKCAYQV
jgi:hypothetical protein